MKFATAALLGLASAATATAQNVVQLDINRRQPGQGPPTLNRRLDSRATYTETLVNNITGGGYYAVVEVGTPGQQMSLVLDTGSADAWVVYYAADLCTSAKLQAYYGDSCGETCESRGPHPRLSSTLDLFKNSPLTGVVSCQTTLRKARRTSWYRLVASISPTWTVAELLAITSQTHLASVA